MTDTWQFDVETPNTGGSLNLGATMADQPRGRVGHLFMATADQIAKSCREQATYHAGRTAWWRNEQDAARDKLLPTIGVELKEFPVSGGGTRIEVVVKYGDPSAYGRLQECYAKWTMHQKQTESYQILATLYASQDPERAYELTAEDVAFFRLDGRKGEE